MKKEISQFESIPKGYGFTYRRMNCLKIVLYPIPYNLIVRWIRELYFILQRGICPTKTERKRQKAWAEGWRIGYKAGQNQTIHRIKDIEEKLDKFLN